MENKGSLYGSVQCSTCWTQHPMEIKNYITHKRYQSDYYFCNEICLNEWKKSDYKEEIIQCSQCELSGSSYNFLHTENDEVFCSEKCSYSWLEDRCFEQDMKW